MNLIDATWDSPLQGKIAPKQLRSFGLMIGGIFATIGLSPMFLHGRDPRLWAILAAGLLIIPALAYPKSLALIYRGWMAAGHVLGWINTKLILTLIFFGLLTPLGFLRRFWHGDPMARRFSSDTETYRVKSRVRSTSHMKQQF